MSTANKYMQSASGAGGEALNVEDVFSTYLYQGTSANQTITNSIDLSKGGLVWVKGRPNAGYSHGLYDTERGVTKRLASNETSAESTYANSVTAFNNNGFSLGSDGNGEANYSGSTYVSWTFRKAPKFFDVVTWTGNGVAGREISHSLGAVPGVMIIKKTSATEQWAVYHRSEGNTKYGMLDQTNAFSTFSGAWNNTTPTDTVFTVGNWAKVNQSGQTYVGYLFAHNNNNGEFGPDADQDIIKCGSYTGNGSTNGPVIDLGFEPQWLLLKNASNSGGWFLYDSMRGLTASSISDAFLQPDSSVAEDASKSHISILSNGFQLNTTESELNSSSTNYIYMAIRRGPMAVPESATDVFDVGDASETGSFAPEYEGGFVVDMAIRRIMSASQPNYIFDRLRGGQSLRTDVTSAESGFGAAKFDYMNGYYNGTSTSSTNWSAMWKRAPNYMDVVVYTGTGSARTVSHNLGVAPEMIWLKRRNSTGEWPVYHKDLSIGDRGLVLQTNSGTYASEYWNNQNPTSTTFPLGASSTVNASGSTYIAYLFASLDGISKVGSYTGSASAQTIDCGFTAGARFVLIKRTDNPGSWVVWDTNRGIVSGSEPYFKLETNAAPETADDYIDPHNSGFTLAGGVGFINTSGGSYIFYAIA